MTRKERDMIKKYRIVFPLDKHPDNEILHEFKEVKENIDKYINDWIIKQAGINLNYCFNNYKIVNVKD